MKSRDRSERHALPAARSKHSARLQRKLKALGSYLSASRASDVIDIEGCYAGVRLWSWLCKNAAAPKRSRITFAQITVKDAKILKLVRFCLA